MAILSCVTPDGQVTIPRSIMKTLGIASESNILIEIKDGQLVLKKIENNIKENGNNDNRMVG